MRVRLATVAAGGIREELLLWKELFLLRKLRDLEALECLVQSWLRLLKLLRL